MNKYLVTIRETMDCPPRPIKQNIILDGGIGKGDIAKIVYDLFESENHPMYKDGDIIKNLNISEICVIPNTKWHFGTNKVFVDFYIGNNGIDLEIDWSEDND